MDIIKEDYNSTNIFKNYIFDLSQNNNEYSSSFNNIFLVKSIVPSTKKLYTMMI